MNTFNISTTAAFVVSAAGLTVAKHGNRAVSSSCGSADVLEALGVNIEVGPEIVEECVQQIGIGFLFAAKTPWGHEVRHRAAARDRHPDRLQHARSLDQSGRCYGPVDRRL